MAARGLESRRLARIARRDVTETGRLNGCRFARPPGSFTYPSDVDFSATFMIQPIFIFIRRSLTVKVRNSVLKFQVVCAHPIRYNAKG